MLVINEGNLERRRKKKKKKLHSVNWLVVSSHRFRAFSLAAIVLPKKKQETRTVYSLVTRYVICLCRKRHNYCEYIRFLLFFFGVFLSPRFCFSMRYTWALYSGFPLCLGWEKRKKVKKWHNQVERKTETFFLLKEENHTRGWMVWTHMPRHRPSRLVLVIDHRYIGRQAYVFSTP